jgi:hypothetical protein
MHWLSRSQSVFIGALTVAVLGIIKIAAHSRINQAPTDTKLTKQDEVKADLRDDSHVKI